MSQPTLATVRGWVQGLVIDTAGYLGNSAYLDYINHALFAYSEMFPDLLPLNGLIQTQSISSGVAKQTIALSGATVRNVTGVFLRGKGPLVETELLDVIRRQSSDTAHAQPQQYALVSTDPGATSASTYSYDMYFWPLPDMTYSVDIYGTVEPTPYAADSDYCSFQDAECRTIARMAALDAARALGRDSDFIQSIAQGLPDAVKARMLVQQRDVGPRAYAGKSVA